MKRFIGMALVAVLLLGLVALPALADELLLLEETEEEETTQGTEDPDPEDPAPLILGWDITGAWSVVVTYGQTTSTHSMSLTMAPETGAVTVTGQVDLVTYTLTGQVTGSDVTLKREDGTYWAELTGTITATAMAGTWVDSNQTEGAWTATGAAAPVLAEGVFAWLPPIAVEGHVVGLRSTVPIKFRLAGEATGVAPVLKVTCGEVVAEITLKSCANGKWWMGQFRATETGEHTAEVYVGEVAIGSITFNVSEGEEGEEEGAATAKGKPEGVGQARAKDGGKGNNGKHR